MTHAVTDAESGSVEFRTGHATDTRTRLVGPTITPLTAQQA
ncbi:hypothetical protein [Streptomyces syringium]